MDYLEVKNIAYKLGINEYFRYLPLLFTYRTINTKKPLGGLLHKDEIQFLRENDEVNFEKISYLLQKLPSEVVFIFKAMHIIGVHNKNCGGDTRTRLMKFTEYCLKVLGKSYSWLGKALLFFQLWLKLFLFEHAFFLYKRIYGFLELE